MEHEPRTCNAFLSAVENCRDSDNPDWNASNVTLADLDRIATEYAQSETSRCTCSAAVRPTPLDRTQACSLCGHDADWSYSLQSLIHRHGFEPEDGHAARF